MAKKTVVDAAKVSPVVADAMLVKAVALAAARVVVVEGDKAKGKEEKSR